MLYSKWMIQKESSHLCLELGKWRGHLNWEILSKKKVPLLSMNGALVSPFYANQKSVYEPELEEQSMDFSSWTMVMSTAYATGVDLCFLVLFETELYEFQQS
ncbi:hypothetical protein V6N13_049423 [Hibiscus sabdariffa]|uniref:Uncharacterized protein n=1 Tax=Hibiscus sabdariffa TaxID=183260 RepID=A0ABR2QXU2_9ROSI